MSNGKGIVCLLMAFGMVKAPKEKPTTEIRRKNSE